ncbi:hypothetical protein GZH53_03465 [Flavihumibacter sp. R14]|nr:hypothetical protein [Flavihumibacter soli]
MSTYPKALTLITLLLVTLAAKGQRMPYTNQTDAGVLIGTPSATSFSAQTFNGVTIRKWNLDAGITTGIDLYNQVIILPLSAGFKWNPFRAHTVSPVISLNGGYGFTWLQRRKDDVKYEGGVIINPSIGLRIKTKSRSKINVALGFRQQKAEIYQPMSTIIFDYFGPHPNMAIMEEYKFRRLTFSLGLSF